MDAFEAIDALSLPFPAATLIVANGQVMFLFEYFSTEPYFLPQKIRVYGELEVVVDVPEVG